MKLLKVKGKLSNILTVFILDATSITGSGISGLSSTSSIVGGFVREGQVGVPLTVNEEVTTLGTYQAPTSPSNVRIGVSANMRPGTYEIHLHDDLFASGADNVSITLGGAINMVDLQIEIQLTGFDPDDAQDLGLGSLTGNVPQSSDHTSAISAIPITPMRGTDNVPTDKIGYSLSSLGISAIWHQLLTSITLPLSVGKLIKDFIDVAISSRNSVSPPSVVAIRTEIDNNSTKLSSITELRLAELDPVNLPADIDILKTGVIVTTNNDKTGYTISVGGIPIGGISSGAITDATTSLDFENAIRDAVWSKVVETQGSFTAQQTLSVLLALCGGVTNTGGSRFLTPNGSVSRALFTYDVANNRLTATITPSS